MSERQAHRRTGAQTHRRTGALGRRDLALLVAVTALVASGCSTLDKAVGKVPWFTTMRDQPSIQPFELPRTPPPGSVPVTGREDSLDLLLELTEIRNPVAATPASLARGGLIWGQYCVVCHGPGGLGDGTVVPKFVPPPDLTQPSSLQRSDGYIYAVLRQGRGIMPRYGERIRGADRWNVVNYLRVLQERRTAQGAGNGGQ